MANMRIIMELEDGVVFRYPLTETLEEANIILFALKRYKGTRFEDTSLLATVMGVTEQQLEERANKREAIAKKLVEKLTTFSPDVVNAGIVK